MSEHVDLPGLLARAHRALSGAADRRAEREFQVTSTQMNALIALGEIEPATPSALALALGLKKPAVTGLTQRMEAAGLVSRMPDSADRRSHRIARTPRGREIAEAAGPLARSLESDVLAGIEQADLDAVRRVLWHVMTRAERDGRGGGSGNSEASGDNTPSDHAAATPFERRVVGG